jgi:anhydro-N-acetylmuramic acid kinase
VLRADSEQPRLWLGLNSGTSADAVDCVLLRVRGGGNAREIAQLGFASEALPAALQTAIRGEAGRDWAAFAALHFAMGEFLGAAGRRFLESMGVSPSELTAAASHGQTVYHHGGNPQGGTLQAGALSCIAQQLGAPVAGDFRWADLAAGGQGAPISPYGDQLLLGAERERVVLNLGGIANLSWLRPGLAPLAWDSGPANGPLDALTRAAWGQPCDLDGAGAERGTVLDGPLATLLEDSYWALPAPKSTGLEAFGAALVENLSRLAPAASVEDRLATLCALVARTVADSLRAGGWSGGEVLLCGGGARNPALVGALQAALPEAAFAPYLAHGVDGISREAAVFALLGDALLLGEPASGPSTTGARASVVLGNWSPVPILDPD